MADENTILSDEAAIVRALQLTIRRQLDGRGISLKSVAFDSGLSSITPTAFHVWPVRKIVPGKLIRELIDNEISRRRRLA